MSENPDPGSAAEPIDPKEIRIAVSRACLSFANNGEAARFWCAFGLSVLPIVQGQKFSPYKWDEWFDGDDAIRKVTTEWARHPDQDVGFVVGDGLIVFDADSPASIAALDELERRFNLTANLVVRTRKGIHHYFRRAAGTYAKQDSHSTAHYPARIDIKTGRALVVLPPSGGRAVTRCEAKSVADLTEVGQDFIDAIFAHNGRAAPRLAPVVSGPRVRPPLEFRASTQRMSQLAVLLDFLDPDESYEDWLHGLMALHHETGGSDEGLELAVQWSSGGEKFRGRWEVEEKWRSFENYDGVPITVGSLIYAVQQRGIDWQAALEDSEPQFEPCSYEVLDGDAPAQPSGPPHPLDRYSMLGRSDEVQRQMVEQTHVLGELALSGQATVLYAAPNTGKTLITLALLIEAIRAGRITPGKLFYVNVDDTAQGLLHKLEIAEEFRFNMLAEGYREFSARTLLDVIADLTAGEHARGSILVLDTMKKFVDLMDKAKASRFTNVMRQFVLQGGTVIALAHTNKHPKPDGTPVYSGTSDVVDDFDCAYTVQQVALDDKAQEKVVRFVNFKRRGNVVQSVAYRYTTERGPPYDELLMSVREVDEMQLVPIIQAEAMRTDAELIGAVLACIAEGINGKTHLALAVAERMKVSRRTALSVIERYTGDDPTRQRWRFTVRDHGERVYEPLERSAAGDPEPEPSTG